MVIREGLGVLPLMNRTLSLMALMLLVYAGVWACSVEVDGPDGLVTVTIASVSPTSGPIAGGTLVTARGTNFTKVSVDSVRFGGVKAPLVTVNNDSIATVTTPARAAGT